MLRMIRSARSRLQREQGIGAADGLADASHSSSAAMLSCDTSVSSLAATKSSSSAVGRRHSDACITAQASGGGIGSSSLDQQLADRAGKRTVSTRSMFGGAGRRMTRSRSTADATKGSENTAPLSHAQLQPGGGTSRPLGDVTNVPGGRSAVSGLRATPGNLLDTKLDGTVQVRTEETGSTCASTPCTPGTLECDAAHAEDPQFVGEYVVDIYRQLQRVEANDLPQPTYMEKQPHVNGKMRGILVDWLVDVHKKYKLRAETLFLAVAIVDRYLELRVMQRRHLQLVGVTALLISAKFEELYPPQINDFVYVTDSAYTRDEVLKMEVIMLSALQFKICSPTPAHFLERYQSVNGCTQAHRDLAQYLLELTLVDYKMIKYAPSHLAAGAILLSNKLLRRQPSWTPAAVKHTKLTEQMLKGCAKEICALLEGSEQSPWQAVRKKYSAPKYHSVAKLNFLGPVPTYGASGSLASPLLLPTGTAAEDAQRKAGDKSRSNGGRHSIAGGDVKMEPATSACTQMPLVEFDTTRTSVEIRGTSSMEVSACCGT
eukprot:gnl/TRDRNA2_/TRDRNA2_184744_c0_seq1.p1 gnl/TRDRNA2_/TRDRNA2_184744_c0~~gnl/TRDRNA2_/TRDRNA2_184744_c0_seq1.p1  ORF type:complete len:545 (+),score=99.01 gnl/TRDRNA2_/TRDRNA2_184744_c0_seq1:77-1711(+)